MLRWRLRSAAGSDRSLTFLATPSRALVQRNGGFEPNADMPRLLSVQRQQISRPSRPENRTALQQRKRSLGAAAASFVTSMTELRTKLPLAFRTLCIHSHRLHPRKRRWCRCEVEEQIHRGSLAITDQFERYFAVCCCFYVASLVFF